MKIHWNGNFYFYIKNSYLIMKKICLIFLCFLTLSFISCDNVLGTMNSCNGPQTEKVDNSSQAKPKMMNSFEKNFNKLQFDSVCRVEQISNKLKDWHMFISKDAETGEAFQEYMYIKSVGENEAIYRLIISNNNNYKLTKRIIKE